MKVKELIAELQKYDGELQLVSNYPFCCDFKKINVELKHLHTKRFTKYFKNYCWLLFKEKV
jgi:hypothetical protein